MEENNAGKMFLNISFDGLGVLIFIIFLILKLTGAWPEISWFWVFFPLWIGVVIGIVLTTVIILVAIIISRL